MNKGTEITFTILGEPASKSNSRRMIRSKGRMLFIKSQKALDYVKGFREQCPKLPNIIIDDVMVTAHIYYASRRPDLDPSLIFDAMQGLIIENDRQIKVQHLFWHLDRDDPRSIITVEVL